MKKLLIVFLFFLSICQLIIGNPLSTPFYKTIEKSAALSPDSVDLGKLMKVTRFNLELIPPSLGVQFYRNGIVFLSNTKNESRMVESHTSFGTIESYFAVCQDTSTGSHVIFSSTDSWEVPSDGMTFNSDYSVMYYTMKPGNKEAEKIFQARFQTLKNGKKDWVADSKPLGFCNDKSVYTHPTLSSDGEKIIFSSNRKDGIGGLDLYIVKRDGISWTLPENLGDKINTKGNELYPFLDQENNLFFSSDGIPGKGGYDIFFCRYNGNGWDNPVNLTYKINTPDDELAFTLNRLDGRSAFFSTRSRKGNRQVQLFKVAFVDQYAQTGIKDISGAYKYLAMKSLPLEAPVQAGAKVVEKPVAQAVTKQESGVTKPTSASPSKAVTSQTQQKAQGQKSPVPAAASQAKTSGPSASSSGEVIYRVQFASSSKPKGSFEINFGGKAYKTFEYLYNGAYRSCAGEFSSLSLAANLQNVIKKEGYPDAFVVAFRNNVRVTDPALFRK